MSWNPTERVALQVSWADVHSPEQLSPLENQTRWSASAIYTRPVGATGLWSTTVAWGRKDLSDGPDLNAWLLETAIKPSDLWTIFARGEVIESNELFVGASGHQQPVETVKKTSLGLIRDLKVSPHVKLGLGGLYTFNWTPAVLQSSYGGNPNGAMAFVRLKIE